MIKGRIISIIRKIKINQWIKNLREKNNNMNPTIICNNCVAGIIYHDLGLKFNSPTINLSIQGEDYLNFVSDLKYYTNCEIIDVTPADSKYPIGECIGDKEHKAVRLHFQHYQDFESAVKKWNERCKRINYDNLFVIWEFYDNLYDLNLLRRFDELPYNKVALTHNKFPEIKCSYYVSCYENNLPYGQILKYDGITGKRYLDEFDYVSFLNE